MRTLLLYITMGLISIPATGQPNDNSGPVERETAVVLWKELQTASSDTQRIRIQAALVNIYLHFGSDTALILLDRMEAISKKGGYPHGLIEAFQLKGTYYEVNSKDYKKALHFYKAGLDAALSSALYEDIHDLSNNILNLYFYLGEFINAMGIASDGLLLAEKHNDHARKAHYHNVIGFIHLRQKNLGSAEQHYRLYIDLARQMKDSVAVGDALNNLGEVLLEKKDYDGALTLFNEARKIFFDLYDQGKLNKKDRLAYVLFQVGYAYGSAGDIAKAISYTNEALLFTRRYSCNSYDVARYHIYSGRLHLQKKAFTAAARLLRTGLGIAITINHKENKRDGYFYMHRLFAARKQYDSAYLYYSKYDALKDSILNETTSKAISQMESQYQLEKKDAEISLLNQEKKMQETEIRRQGLLRNVVILFSSLVVLVVVLVVNRMHLKRKNRLQSEINQKQTEMFNLTAAVQDKERKRIAQDLHDGMGTLLSAAKLKLSSINTTHSEIGDTLILLDDATAELRNISHNIMPAALSKLGLIPALKNLVERISETKDINIGLISHGTNYRLPEEKEIFIYRIMLELVNNIVKHSKATEATIQLVQHPGHINITVEDNGIGFNNERLVKGMGLSNVRSRVQFLQGTFYIDSSEGKGTTMIIDIPG